MADIKMIDLKNGKEGKVVTTEDAIFKAEFRKDLLNDYVIMQRRAARQGTHKAKTRGEVHGTQAKPFRQKGTGNARQGSLKGPHQEGGGVAFGPSPRKYSSNLNRKTKISALRSALSQKVFETKLNIVDSFEISSGKTKDAAAILKAMKTDSLLVIGDLTAESRRALRNLPKTKALPATALNVFDLLKHDRVLLTKTALDWVNENLRPSVAKEKVA